MEHGVLPDAVQAAGEPGAGRACGAESPPVRGSVLQPRRPAARSGSPLGSGDAVRGGRPRRRRAAREPPARRPVRGAGAHHAAREPDLRLDEPRVRGARGQRLRRSVHRLGHREPLHDGRQRVELPRFADRDAQEGDPGQGVAAPGGQPVEQHRRAGLGLERSQPAAGGDQQKLQRRPARPHRARGPVSRAAQHAQGGDRRVPARRPLFGHQAQAARDGAPVRDRSEDVQKRFPQDDRAAGRHRKGARQHLAGVVEEMVDRARKAAYAEYQTALRQEKALEQEMHGLKSEALDEQLGLGRLSQPQPGG